MTQIYARKPLFRSGSASYAASYWRGVGQNSVPQAALLTEDGIPILTESGEYILTES